MKRNICIIGGGWSGLCLTKFFNDKDIIPTIYSDNFDGGLLNSWKMLNSCVDLHGSHIVFSKDPKTMEEMSVYIKNRLEVKRNTVIATDDGFVSYPYENGMINATHEKRMRLFNSIIGAKNVDNPTNLKEVFLSMFGEDACDDYFFSLNEKTWKTPMEQLSPTIGNRIPKPSQTYLQNLKDGVFEDGYTHQLTYLVSKNGIREMYNELKKRLRYNEELDYVNRKFRMKNSISTIPLDKVGKLMGINTKSLRKTSLKVYFVKTNKQIPYSWIYDASKKYAFNRVYSGFGDTPILCFEETSLDKNFKTTEKDISKWVDRNFNGDIKVEDYITDTYREYAYPVPTVESDIELPKIREELKKYNISTFGRFGDWQYYNTDQIYTKAKEFVNNYEVK